MSKIESTCHSLALTNANVTKSQQPHVQFAKTKDQISCLSDDLFMCDVRQCLSATFLATQHTSIFHQTSVKFQRPKMQAENDVSPPTVKMSSKSLSQIQHKQALNCENLPKIDRETAAQCQ